MNTIEPKDNQAPLTTGQVAKYCHVTHRGVLKWVASGKLKAYRTPGKHSRVSREDFIAFLKEYKMPIPQELAVREPAKKKVLIVDDDRGMVHSLQRLLMLEDQFTIETAFDGFEAGQKFVAFGPDLVILDIHMPGMDGYQVCVHIRQKLNNTKVKILAITGASEADEAQRIITLGADDYLLKPFKHELMKEKIKRLVVGT